MNQRLTLLWFLLGLGSKLQLFNVSLSISEVIVYISAPFLLIKDYGTMKRDGVMPLFILSLLVILGCGVACWSNHTSAFAVLRGFSVTVLVSCSIVFAHWLLRRDPANFKWFFLGVAISGVLNVFIFQRSVEVAMYGQETEAIMSGPLFWIERIRDFVFVPVRGWYLHVPVYLSVLVTLFIGCFSILTSASGRAVALGAIAACAMMIIGGRTRRGMSRISRNFGILCIGAVLGIFVIYFTYRTAALNGWLGVQSQKKYETQSKGENSIGRLILGGRSEAFIGLLACRDKPIIGWGPWAKDEKGYSEEFITKYGTAEDVEVMVKSIQYRARVGYSGIRMLPCHAYITEFWAWYGIWGLVFWVYIIIVLLRFLKKDCFRVPHWFAWVACGIPSLLWDIFFSPFADRFGVMLIVVACLMARALRKGAFQLPNEMVIDMIKSENR